MENLKLLFIEGNRQNIDKENIKACYNKIKSLGFIKTMPIEYTPMDEAIGKIGGRKLFKVTVERNIGNGEAIISNFKIHQEVVASEDYSNYDGVCEDGQHRSLALQFSELSEIEPTYTEVHIPEVWMYLVTLHCVIMVRFGTTLIFIILESRLMIKKWTTFFHCAKNIRLLLSLHYILLVRLT